MKYRFRTAVGTVCCAADHIDHLCDDCRAQALGHAETNRVLSTSDVPPAMTYAEQNLRISAEVTLRFTPDARLAKLRLNMQPPPPPDDRRPARRVPRVAIGYERPPAPMTYAEQNRLIRERRNS